MQLPDTVKGIRARYVVAFPVPQGASGDEFEERARQWSTRLAEQVAFELPNQGWGMKRADPNRPVSKDTIALNANGRLLIWDLLTGTGTGSPRLVDAPESEDITGQVFVPVEPTNHLAPVAPSPPSAAASALGALPESRDAVLDHLAAIRSTLDAILREQQTTRELLKTFAGREP